MPLYAHPDHLSRGRVLRGARRLVAASQIPARKVKLVDARGHQLAPRPAHSAPGKSRFLKTVVPWLK